MALVLFYPEAESNCRRLDHALNLVVQIDNIWQIPCRRVANCEGHAATTALAVRVCHSSVTITAMFIRFQAMPWIKAAW